MTTTGPKRLTRSEIETLVYDWIGVHNGYLGEFSYATHDRFWRQVADLDVDTANNPTTRRCFENTLGSVDAATQAVALREILALYPAPENANPRSAATHTKILKWISRLETGDFTIGIALVNPSELVQRALNDVDALLAARGLKSASS